MTLSGPRSTAPAPVSDGVFDRDPVPLAWVRAQPGPPPHANVGDALSPFLVTMVSGRPVVSAAFDAKRPRMAAIGTVAQKLRGGAAEIWGAGCAPWIDSPPNGRRPYAPPSGLSIRLHATRGPLTARRLADGARTPDIPFGDPATLLPRFHPRPPADAPGPRVELGVVLHLSELADHGFEARPREALRRYAGLPADGSVRLITMVAPPTAEAVRDKIDELLACRRIVSTSLHGFAIPAAYGIPAFHLGGDPGPEGVACAGLDDPGTSGRVNDRFLDLLLGAGEREIVYWRQRRRRPTDWDALIRALDAEARPLAAAFKAGGEALAAACPAGCASLAAPEGGVIWDHPLIRAVPFDRPWGPLARAGRRVSRAFAAAMRGGARRGAR